MLEWILENTDVQLLMLFDVCFHGHVVAECLRQESLGRKEAFDEWLRTNKVQASAPHFLLPYIERVLYMQGCVCERMDTAIVNPVMKTYTFPDARLRVELTYDIDGSSLNIPQARRINSRTAAIDVHLLSLNRHALFSRQIDLRPIMLHHLQERCRNGTFEILTLNSAQVTQVEDMIISGWRRLRGVQSSVYVSCAPDKERCTICQYALEDGDVVAQLPSCGHEFHIGCWRQLCTHQQESDDTFQFTAPVQKSFVNCPICRAEVHRARAVI